MKLETKANLAMGAFLLACLIPSLGMLVLPEEPAAANQALAPPPALTTREGGVNPQVLGELTDYVEDHFALRQRLITANAALEAALFHTSAQDSVLLGEEDWLFYKETVDDYLHTDPLTERELFGAARTLALLSEYAQSCGASLTFTVAPNKASLYPNYLPYVGIPLNGEDDIDRLIPLLEEQGVAYVDLFAPFEERYRERGQVLYHAADSHWTNQGAALAHDTLMEALGGPTRWEGAVWTESTHRGDLYEMVYPTGTRLEQEFVPAQGFAFQAVRPIRGPEDLRIQTECPGQAGSLLMFRDSFGNTLYPFMASSFGQAVFSRSMPWQMTLLDETGADTVVIELVERNLDYLAQRAPIFPAPQRGLTGTPPVGEASARVSALEDGSLAGYLRLEGGLSGPVDADSPIYVQLGGALYEASPAGESGEDEYPFTLYVPAGPALDDIRVLYLLDGQVLQAGQTELIQP